MTANELREHFNTTFGLGEWPQTFEVDHVTYANVVQALIDQYAYTDSVTLLIGSHNGILFKNVELILNVDSDTKV